MWQPGNENPLIPPFAPGKMNPRQKYIVETIKKNIKSGKWALSSNKCLCGQTASILIADQDRYGIELRSVLCVKCGVVRSDPYYSPESLKDFYSLFYRELYNLKPKEVFFKEQESAGKEIVEFCSSYLRPKSSVLEIGCGAGGILRAFKNTGYETLGLDFNEEYLDVGRAKGLTLRKGSLEALAIDEKFDLIIMNHVLEHIPNLNSFLTSLKQRLKPQGMLYLSMPGLLSLASQYGDDFKRFLQNAHCWHFSLFSLTDVLAKHDLRLVSGDERIRALFLQSEKVDIVEALKQSEPERIRDFLAQTRLHAESQGFKKRFKRLVSRFIKSGKAGN